MIYRNIRVNQPIVPENPADLFQQGWGNYELILRYDYLWHRLAGRKLREVLVSRFRVTDTIRFLDLACGSAEIAAGLLSDLGGVRVMLGYPPVEYVGVDTSPMALKRASIAEFGLGGVARSFVESDFVEFLRTDTTQFDVIFVGMSAHHLGLDRLREFFAAVKRRLAPEGRFVAYEPFCLPGELRDNHIDRLHGVVREKWTELPAEARTNVIAHTGECDFPVTLADWNAAAEKAGMNPGKMVLESPDQLYAMVVHEG